MFLEKRVYQGSSGKVYPLPFTDRIASTKTDRAWTAVWLENEFLQVMILPEIGGRIHIARDKTNGYDFIYRQTVIKPALVGLAGPWISGGIEFNWPQHHRPATFLPADFTVEKHSDGSKTVWLSDHDPICRMKGMHGVCLRPGQAVIELKVRAYNRTTLPQSFLWWANAGIRVHESYQSFFPPDVHYVADHARRSTCEYPLCKGSYYGVNYGERARRGVPKDEQPAHFLPSQSPVRYPPNDLSWYANIPTPCSYMGMGSKEDFFGGYDHAAQAGIVHVADHHVSPGKKQWTWGNHAFGYAWDRNLTDSDGPYIELMAGVYTDNQPDFSFLQPGETRAWSQFWYPIQKIGPAHHANLDAAVHLTLGRDQIKIGVSVSANFPKAVIRLERKNGALEWDADLKPGRSFLVDCRQSPKKWRATGTTLRVLAQDGREIIAYSPQPRRKTKVPPPADEPLPPGKIGNADELYFTGLHLEQYRHATRSPVLYWREALRRDPLDARCNNAMGLWHLRRGEFDAARKHFQTAIRRLTRRNPNPYDGEAYYNLGLCLCHLGLLPEAEAALHKAAWNQAWQSAACHALAELACRRSDWPKALELLDRSLRANAGNARARNLRAIVLYKMGRDDDAKKSLRETLALDPLDGWACHLAGREVPGGWQMRLDIALDFARAGLYAEAIQLLRSAPVKIKGPGRPAAHRLPTFDWGAAPLAHYYLGWLREQAGDTRAAMVNYKNAAAQRPDYCFPARLEEITILQAAMRANPRDARAAYYLGNLFYDRRRHEEAIGLWEKSAKLDPTYSVVWRNLGMAYFNIAKQPRKARAAYDKAFRAKPADARLLYERDQLCKRLGEPPQNRLRELEKHRDLVDQRDDLSIELCALYNQMGAPERALPIISQRHFQPWEGGEGQAMAQHVRTHLSLGRRALSQRDAAKARAHFEAALASPENLGEAKHLLANQSDIYYWLGTACAALKDKAAARKYWLAAATFRGDFQQMTTRPFSEMTYYSALAWGRLGQTRRMKKLLRDLLNHARRLGKAKAQIDYFATSLPTLLLFDDDIQFRQETTALFLQAQAHLGLGRKTAARRLLASVRQRDPNHAPALDL